METPSVKSKKSSLTALEIFLVIIFSCLVCLLLGGLVMRFMGWNFSSLLQPQSNLAALPDHTVSDYQSNDSGTGVVYVIVADKSLTEEDAKKIISYYENKHPSYKIMNVWIFCDNTYAGVKYVNGVQYSDSPYLSHVMYWSMSNKLGKGDRWFHSGPDADFPAFRSACK